MLLGILSTPASRPLITAARLRKGNTNSARGAHRLVADSLVTARSCGATGTLVLRADSAFFQSDEIGAVLRHKASFSITARLNPPVRKAIDAIAEDAWTKIKYTNAVWDEQAQAWISDAEVAEIAFTAFGSKAKTKQVTARLIVRRVPDLNPTNQDPLFTVYRHHAVFTSSLLPMLDAEKAQRAHAIVEQVIADLKAGPLAHLPGSSGPTVPGWSAPRWPSTSPAPPASLPSPSTLKRRPARSVRSSSTSPPGWLAPTAHSPCSYRPTGHGRPNGNSSAPEQDHPARPEPRPPSSRSNRKTGERRTSRPHRRAQNLSANTSSLKIHSRAQDGGSGLSCGGIEHGGEDVGVRPVRVNNRRWFSPAVTVLTSLQNICDAGDR